MCSVHQKDLPAYFARHAVYSPQFAYIAMTPCLLERVLAPELLWKINVCMPNINTLSRSMKVITETAGVLAMCCLCLLPLDVPRSDSQSACAANRQLELLHAGTGACLQRTCHTLSTRIGVPQGHFDNAAVLHMFLLLLV